MTRSRLRRGMTVYLWFANAVRRGVLQRRGLYALRKHWRVLVDGPGGVPLDVHYAARHHLHLCRADALNAL